MDSYDSRPETYAHIIEVQKRLQRMVGSLVHRMVNHDQSKLVEPELSGFNAVGDSLAKHPYGSEEYNRTKSNHPQLAPAVAHHYANNFHHPQFYGEDGMKGMTLCDLVEMLCDWSAATLRSPGGCIYKSIEMNQEKFGYPDFLKEIFINTAEEYGL